MSGSINHNFFTQKFGDFKTSIYICNRIKKLKRDKKTLIYILMKNLNLNINLNLMVNTLCVRTKWEGYVSDSE